MKIIREVERETYGHDKRAINKHSARTYVDNDENYYILSRCNDGIPPFFEAYGAYAADYTGLLPRLKVNGLDYWGDGWTWKMAEVAFFEAIRQKYGQ